MKINLSKELSKKENELNKLLKVCEESNKNVPEGKIRIDNGKKKPHYYYRKNITDERGIYLNKNNIEIAKRIIQKEYDEKVVKETIKQLNIIEKLKNDYKEDYLQEIYMKFNPYRQALIDKRFQTNQEYVEEWLAEEYEGLGFDINDDSDYYLDNDIRVRSKSEILIGNALIRKGIPFKYESPISFGRYDNVYPDFTCLNARTREVIVWEHLGKLGDEKYAGDNTKKIEKYILNGYILGRNLIITMESKNSQISSRVIEKTINDYLL